MQRLKKRPTQLSSSNARKSELKVRALSFPLSNQIIYMTSDALQQANKLDAERRYLQKQLKDIEAIKPDTILFAKDLRQSVHPFEKQLLSEKIQAQSLDLFPHADNMLRVYVTAVNKRIRAINREIEKL